MGNEAIARGALEAGVRVATGYPGTPSTEIIEALAEVSEEMGIYVEWSTNEKIALEVAMGASMCGLRSLAAMKHVGLNVAMDPFMSSAYTGAIGGLIIVSADDPSCHSSQNEQDNRLAGLHALIPVMEPYSPGEAKEIVKEAFDFSEKHETPVILRTTTRVSHSRGNVRLGNIEVRASKGHFEKNVKRWVLIPSNARVRRGLLLEKWDDIKRDLSHFKYNRFEDHESDETIIASGIAYGYVKEAVRALGLEEKVNILKISTPVPLPEKLVGECLESSKRVLVVEELEPVVEFQVKKLAFELGLNCSIYGKNIVPRQGELNSDIVVDVLRAFFKSNLKATATPVDLPKKPIIPPRPPVLCPGCPHRATFYALKRAVGILKLKPVYTGDIGCYTLGVLPPYEMTDTTICMGASIGLANGLSKFQENPVIAFIGDSTFFHSGIPSLINAVYNDSPMLVVIMDNRTTAMTGHQPHPGTGVRADGSTTASIRIEDLAKACGVDYVYTIDPFNLEDSTNTFRKALKTLIDYKKPIVVVSRRECVLITVSRARREGRRLPKFRVDVDKCTGCSVCTRIFGCPAISIVEEKAVIDDTLCTGCGVCLQVCPYKAIYEVEA